MKHLKLWAALLCLVLFIPFAAQAGADPVPIAVGKKVTLDFVEFCVTGKEVRPSLIGSANAGRVFQPSEKSKYFCLKGTICNLGLEGFSVKDISFEFKFNDKYNYSGEGLVELDGVLKSDLDPLYDGTLWVVATVPNKLVDIMETCTVTVAFNENILSAPISPEDADYVYTLEIGKEDTEAAKQGPEIKATYFKECPALPEPTSLVSLRQSGHSTSSTNGKQTKNVYRYTGAFSKDDDKKLFEEYLNKLLDYGATVNKSGSKYQIIISGKTVAEITYNDSTMEINLKAGNEKMKPVSGKGSRTEKKEKETRPKVKLGGKIKLSSCNMTIQKALSGTKLFSNIDSKNKNNRHHWYYSQSGNKLVALYGVFRNKLKEPVDIRNIYCVFEVDGKYSYTGSVTAIMKDGSDFYSDVSPMEDVKFYAYAEIPNKILKKMKKCVVHLGFTDNFGIKTVTHGGLPDLTRCDDVYDVTITSKDF